MKRIRWIIVGSLFFCMLIFHHAFLTFLASWALQVFSVSHWGGSLQYENLSLIGTRLVIIQPRFEHASSFKAERIALNFNVHLWKRQLDVEIEIEQPHWHFQMPMTSQWEKWAKLLSQEENWIKIHPHLHIKKGLVTWSFEEEPSHQLHFDLAINNQEGGSIQLYFDSEESMTPSLVLQTFQVAHGVEINCTCEKISCPSFIALAQFFGVNVSPWQLTSGSLHGQLKAIFPRMKRPYLEGELIVEKLIFNQLGIALNGQIEQARLKLEKNQPAYELNDQISTTIGQLDILKPASLSYDSPIHAWTLQRILGSIQLNPMATALINLEAQRGDDPHGSCWGLTGKANLNAQRSFNLDLTLSCYAWGQPNGKMHLALNQLQEGHKHAEMQLENLSHADCDFLQTLLATYWPIFNEVLLTDGKLNALIEADVMHQGIGELHIKQFEAFGLRSKIKPWNMSCDFEQIRGSGKVHLGKQDFWQSLTAELHVEEGKIQFENLSPSLPLTDIQAHLLIQQGHVEHSLITLQLAGLKGKMDVEWGKHKQLLTFKLDGIVEDLAHLLPNSLQEGLHKHFHHNHLMVLANFKRQNQQIELGGTLHIQRTNTDQMDLIHFGCDLKKIQEGSESKYVPVGWFHAQKLPLEKFLSPFIFRNGILQMSGEAEFKGSFDDQFLLIKYDVNDLKIENDNLCIEIPQLYSQIPGQLVGSHRLDLHTSTYQGTLPIQYASYFEKNTGLAFQSIQGLMTFKNDFIRIAPIESYCEGIYFSGELELDYSDPVPGVFDVKIHCPTFSGKVSQIQDLVAHLDQPSLLHTVPLEGDVTSKEEGLHLNFTFIPNDYQFKANIRGAMTDGRLVFKEADMALKGIDMDIDYDHQQQLLAFTDIQGAFLVGKPRRVEEYLFTGHHVHFYQIAQPNIDIDVAIKDKEKELLRLVGYTQEEQGGVKSLYLNQKLSHLSCLYPHVWQCKIKNGAHLEQLEFRSEFDVGNLFHDLCSFRKTGFSFLSPNIIDKISQFLPLEGQGFCALHYHPDQSYTYQLEGRRIKQGNLSEHFGCLKGSKHEKKWIVDQLQWDDWNVYAELHQMEDKWKIPFLGLKVGQAVLLGLEGDWFHEHAFLQAKLKFCEVDLDELDHFDALKPFVTKWWPKGKVNATGEIEWNLLTSNFWEGCQASLLAEASNLSFRDYPLRVLNSFKIDLHPLHHFRLENLHLELFPLKSHSYIDLKTFEYLTAQDSIGFMQTVFNIPHTQLKIVGEALHHHFPDVFDVTVKELFVNAKREKALKGVLTVEHRLPGQNFLQLKLEDGLYLFKKREYDLKQFDLQMIGEDLRFSAFSQQECYPFQVIGQSKWPACQQVQCQFIGAGTSQPLMVQWQNHPQQGWMLHAMQGDFGGCSFRLREDQEAAPNTGWMALQGQITVDFNQLCPLLSRSVAEAIQKLKMGSFYSFIGHFWMNSDVGSTFLDTISFQGSLTSEKAILKGYQVQSLQADVQYVPGRLDMQNVWIQDPAGNLKAANCMVIQDQKFDKWTFFIPSLTVKNLRLNHLRDAEDDARINSKFRSLIVKRIEFQDLSGELNQLHTWQAEGNLHFVNPSRKNFFHPLLAIPAEIILRLGLDPHVFNPVTGIIYFRLQNRRFYFNRFKDVYSEGRGSKFYLAQDNDSSWMDFDGNLSVNVRMKQYNLIFKIAELFTVSIQGNIKRPRYSLQKQSKGSRKRQMPPMVSS